VVARPLAWRRTAVGVVASAAAVAAVTAAIAAVDDFVPVLSLGALYIFAVLPVAIGFGFVFALGVSVASMLAFNWFFLPPTHTLMLREGSNWLALAVFVVTALVASELAARARRRAAQAEQREREAAALARELVEAEAIRRSDAIKTAILRAVSHDLRSPLTAIAAAVSALQSAALQLSSADREALLETIRAESDRLDRLVSNLLDLSRLEAGAAHPRPELWSADELLAQALDEVRGGERVAVELPPDLPPVRVDAVQIQRALVNLLDNALKFSPAESRVVVRGETVGDRVVLRVLDGGPGLAPGDAERVFEPFRRGEGRGTGLGLAIARGFAEANGARVWAEDGSGGGAFALELPAVRA
jgi:two-component system sensor histidine kinase KdpD